VTVSVFVCATACNASRVLAIVKASVCLSVCPSHSGVVSTQRTKDHEIFTMDCHEDSSFRIRKAFPEIRKGSPRSKELYERGTKNWPF